MKRITPAIVALLTLLVLFAPSAAAQDDPPRIIFMHHSTGAGLIWEGGVREAFTDLSYEFWDHGYNEEGLLDADGTPLRTNWNVPGDNTDPDGWHAIFNQPVTSPPTNTFSHMLEFDVIIFKSCFPASNIVDDAMFQQYQAYYLDMRDMMDQHPDRLFILFTTPPLVPNATTPENAARAQQWAAYLTSPTYLEGHPNITVFDFFSHLADVDGYLRAEYRVDAWDSHPNTLANETVGLAFVAFVDEAIRSFEPGAAPIPSDALSAGAVPTATAVPTPDGDSDGSGDGDGDTAVLLTGDLLFAGFEPDAALADWWGHSGAGVQDFACGRSQPGYDSPNALHVSFDIPPESSAGCGVSFAPQDWSQAAGIRFDWRSDQPGLYLRVALAVQDPAQATDGADEATPFEIELQTSGTEWSEVVIDWDDLAKVDWVVGGVDAFDPAHIVWLAFDFGHWQQPQQGTIWIDNLQLVP
jgi:hypothetical protein